MKFGVLGAGSIYRFWFWVLGFVYITCACLLQNGCFSSVAPSYKWWKNKADATLDWVTPFHGAGLWCVCTLSSIFQQFLLWLMQVSIIGYFMARVNCESQKCFDSRLKNTCDISSIESESFFPAILQCLILQVIINQVFAVKQVYKM